MKIDGYLPCESYSGHVPSDGFSKFTDNGEFYFSMLAQDGSVLLRSEGYTNEPGRDNGIQSVKNNRELKERYKIVQADGQWYVSLVAGNRQEIARSCGYASEADLYARWGFLKEGSSDDFAWNIKPAPVAALADTTKKASDGVDDDYLVCSEYRDRIADSKSTKYPGFITFQHKNGEYYFALLDNDGDIHLRSEGYTTESARDNGIESVMKNKEIPERFSTEERRGFHFLVLKAGNRQEIARSCPYKSGAEAEGRKGKLGAAALAAAGTAAAATIATPDPTPKVEEVKPAYVAPSADYSKKVEAEPAAAAYTDSDSGGGFGRWLPWLLGALLLGGLLWWLMKGCNKPAADAGVAADTTAIVSDSSTVDGTAVAADTTSATVADSAAEASAPVAAAAGTCNCSGNADAMWNKPEGTPKKLPRLGTNPEFARYGDLHAMNNASFLSFLKERAGKSSVDGAFLDRIAKGIGYNSFADVPESAISEVTFDKGTYGNLGWGAAHNTGFDELPDNERDRKAFKITGNGACSIHFMKTCGNHFVPFNQCN